MGQKVNPIGFRLGINRTWDSRWYAEDGYAALLHEDLRIRDFLRGRLAQAGPRTTISWMWTGSTWPRRRSAAAWS